MENLGDLNTTIYPSYLKDVHNEKAAEGDNIDGAESARIVEDMHLVFLTPKSTQGLFLNNCITLFIIFLYCF